MSRTGAFHTLGAALEEYGFPAAEGAGSAYSTQKSGSPRSSAVFPASKVPPSKPDSMTISAFDNPQIVRLRVIALCAFHVKSGGNSETTPMRSKPVLSDKRLDLLLGTEVQHSFGQHERGGAAHFKSAFVGGEINAVGVAAHDVDVLLRKQAGAFAGDLQALFRGLARTAEANRGTSKSAAAPIQ